MLVEYCGEGASLNSTKTSILYCYTFEGVIVSRNGKKYDGEVGSAYDYVGRLIGKKASMDSSNSSLIGLSQLPTVYNVLNKRSSTESEIWSNSNVNAPVLKFEENDSFFK